MRPTDSIVEAPDESTAVGQAATTWADEVFDLLLALLQTAGVLLLVTLLLVALYYAFLVLAPVLVGAVVWVAAARHRGRARPPA